MNKEEKMKSLQRDPNRFCASVYMDIELGEKIMTEIEGEMVERKTRACIHGLKRRKIRTKREKTIGDFLCECAAQRTRKTIPSAKAKAWGRAVLKKNLATRAKADALQHAKKSAKK